MCACVGHAREQRKQVALHGVHEDLNLISNKHAEIMLINFPGMLPDVAHSITWNAFASNAEYKTPYRKQRYAEALRWIVSKMIARYNPPKTTE